MDRRTFFSTAAAVTAVIATPAIAAPLSDFERALSEYRAAKSAFDVPLPDKVADIAATKLDDAFETLLHAPCRSPADVALKLEILMEEYEGCEMDEARVALIAQDARRLAGAAS